MVFAVIFCVVFWCRYSCAVASQQHARNRAAYIAEHSPRAVKVAPYSPQPQYAPQSPAKYQPEPFAMPQPAQQYAPSPRPPPQQQYAQQARPYRGQQQQLQEEAYYPQPDYALPQQYQSRARGQQQAQYY